MPLPLPGEESLGPNQIPMGATAPLQGIRMYATPKQLKETKGVFKELGEAAKAPGIGTVKSLFEQVYATATAPGVEIFSSFMQAFGLLIAGEIDWSTFQEIIETLYDNFKDLAPLIGEGVNVALSNMLKILEDNEAGIKNLSTAMENLLGWINDVSDAIDNLPDISPIVGEGGGTPRYRSAPSTGGIGSTAGDIVGGIGSITGWW